MHTRTLLSRKPRLPGRVSAISAFTRRTDRADPQAERLEEMIHRDRLSTGDPRGEDVVRDEPLPPTVAAQPPMALPQRYPLPLRPSAPESTPGAIQAMTSPGDALPREPVSTARTSAPVAEAAAHVTSPAAATRQAEPPLAMPAGQPAAAARSRLSLSFFGFGGQRAAARQDERESQMTLFVAHARSRRLMVSFRSEDGKFASPITQEAWLAWQAGQPAAGHGTVINLPPAPAVPIDATSLETLTLIVRRLAAQLQRVEPGSPYPARALDFLASHKLLGDVAQLPPATLVARQG